MGNSFELNPQQVKHAIGILEAIPSEMKQEAIQYKTAKEKMLATWDSSYKQAFLNANKTNLENDIDLLSQKLNEFIEAVASTASSLASFDEQAADALK